MLASALRTYVGDNLTDWDLYTPAVTFAYNTQVDSTTGVRSFDLVLSRDIPSLSVEPPAQAEAVEPRLFQESWLSKLQSLISMH